MMCENFVMQIKRSLNCRTDWPIRELSFTWPTDALRIGNPSSVKVAFFDIVCITEDGLPIRLSYSGHGNDHWRMGQSVLRAGETINT